MKACIIDRQISRITTLAAAAMAALLAVVLPAGFYHFSFQHHAGSIQAEANYYGYVVSQGVSRNPLSWMFEAHRLEELLARHDAPNEAEERCVLDDAGEAVVEHKTTRGPLAWPVLAHAVPIYDSGRVVGTVEVRRSLRPLLDDAIAVAILASVLAGGVFVVLRVLPLRALQGALERVAFLASHDPLTGLPNRGLFHKRLERVLAGQRAGDGPAAVFCIDLDRFKEVNDRLGHDAGDELLRQVARRLVTNLRETDLVARLGGDEFAVIVADQPKADEHCSVTGRLEQLFSEPFALPGGMLLAGASVGVALFPHHTDDPEKLLPIADRAMYLGKEARRTEPSDGTVMTMASGSDPAWRRTMGQAS